MNVKRNHPLAEILAKALFSIENVPKEYQKRMVNRAIKEAVKFYEDPTILKSYEDIVKIIED